MVASIVARSTSESVSRPPARMRDGPLVPPFRIDGGHAPNFIENDTPTTNGVPARTMKPAGTDHYNLPAPFRYE